MGMPADYHMHTPLCRHAVGEPMEYARRAASLGLEEIGFSDHSPMARDDFDDWRMRLGQLDEYVAAVEQARREVPGLRIRLALEVDYIPGHEDWIRSLAARHCWDYLIGSVHYVKDTWDLDNPNKMERWKEQDPWVTWEVYFDRLAMAAESGLFDIIGHADLPKKFGIYPQKDCTPLFERFLRAAGKSGVAIELNTAGLRKPCREIYPSAPFLSLARRAGVPITFGSDAHAPEEVGADFGLAMDWARAAGYGQALRFEGRRRQEVPL